jgi:hypothetical protein
VTRINLRNSATTHQELWLGRRDGDLRDPRLQRRRHLQVLICHESKRTKNEELSTGPKVPIRIPAFAGIFTDMILITGATGTIGSQVVRLLAARGVPVRAMTRNPSGTQWPDGVDVVPGDFGDADSLDRAVDGVESAFLLTAPGGTCPSTTALW